MTHETERAVQTLEMLITAAIRHRGYNKQARDALHIIVADIERLEKEKEKHDRPTPVRKKTRT